MAATSFQFRDPLNRNPYIADQRTPIIYPYPQWGDYGTSSNLYVYGRQIPFRSYFGEDINLTARPISRVIEPSVIEYAPIYSSGPQQTVTSMGHVCPESAQNVTLVPASYISETGARGPDIALNNRFAAINKGEQQIVPLKLWSPLGAASGAQVSEIQKNWKVYLAILLGIGIVGSIFLLK